MIGLTPTRLAAWDADALAAAARSLADDALVLREVEGVVRRAVQAIQVGQGHTADAQRRSGLAHALLARRVAEQTERDAGVVRAAAEVVGAAVRALARAVRLAGGRGLRVDGDGRIDPGPDPDDARVSLADTCSALARQALAAAEEGDADAARALFGLDGATSIWRSMQGLIAPGTLESGEIAAAVARVRARSLPPGATVADRAAWWAVTPMGEQARLAGLDQGLDLLPDEGLPPWVRDAVNRTRLGAELVRVQALLATAGRRPTPAQLVLREQLRVLQSVRSALRAHPDAFLLRLDSTTGSGRAVVALGDVDRADHVAVMVPGLTGWVPGYLDGLLQDARRVREQAASYGSGGSGTVATVTWIGYQAPGFAQVAYAGAAERGVADLRDTLQALQVRATVRGQEQSVTLVGHSYGSLLSGLTARAPTGIDDLVLLGSPGSGARRAAELVVPVGHVWVGEGRFDPVADLGRFGTDPGLGAFGATALPTGRGRDPVLGTALSTSTGHSQYYAAGSGALASVGLVVAGRGGLLRPASLAPGPFPRPTVRPAPVTAGPARKEGPATPR